MFAIGTLWQNIYVSPANNFPPIHMISFTSVTLNTSPHILAGIRQDLVHYRHEYLAYLREFHLMHRTSTLNRW